MDKCEKCGNEGAALHYRDRLCLECYLRRELRRMKLERDEAEHQVAKLSHALREFYEALAEVVFCNDADGTTRVVNPEKLETGGRLFTAAHSARRELDASP